MNIPGEKKYRPTLMCDNFWVLDRSGIDSSTGIVWWILDGERWSGYDFDWFDASLDRMTYFGRAEAITEIQRVEGLPKDVLVNCVLDKNPSSDSVPVLAPTAGATLEQVQAATDDPSVANSTVPPGAHWLYTKRPARPRAKPSRSALRKRNPTRLVQFAIGARVSPPRKSIVVLTNRFRGRVIREFLGGSWQRSNSVQREAARLLTGKEADGTPLQDQRHTHTRFGIVFDPEADRASRLLAWRDQPFTDDEQRAILNAAEQELPLSFAKAGTKDPWAVRLVPLDSQVPPPVGFGEETYSRWKTITPYVPPRHTHKRKNRVKAGESPEEQLRLELDRQGYDTNGLTIKVDDRTVEWTQVHRPKRNRNDPTNTERRGYGVLLTFDKPVRGPISVGHSSHFGMGLFAAIDE